MSRSSVHIIYTGGTIGMMEDASTGRLSNMHLERLNKELPELNKLDVELSASTFMDPVDSCDMTPDRWVMLAARITELYSEYDGFVVLHGSDTMAYTASALSFLLQGLQKPVILTGAQLPIGTLRTDGKENLITAVEIAGSKENGQSIIQEVAVYFEYKLYRGNRVTKISAEHFEAYRTPNWPTLAEAGVKIKYNKSAFLDRCVGPLVQLGKMEASVALVKIFPGMDPEMMSAASKNAKAMVLETFGSGNTPSDPNFFNALSKIISGGTAVINVTQCNGGSVIQGRYGNSLGLEQLGVISAYDMTTESALTKLMCLLGRGVGAERIGVEMQIPVCGELTLS